MRVHLVLGFLVAVIASASCGGAPPIPKRGVVEADVGAWKFRRFQGPLLDLEVWVDGNRGEAYSASYITAASEKRGRIAEDDLANVTVTRYAKADGVVRETVRLARRLAAEKGYQVRERTFDDDVRALEIEGPSELWVMWPADAHVIKIGGQGRTTVATSLVAHYGERYPSKLPGGSLEGALPPGPDRTPDAKDPYDPSNPKPDIDQYDPKKVKLPQ